MPEFEGKWIDWMLMPLKRYADFSGRSRRLEYWMFSLFNAMVVLGLVLIVGVIGYLTGGFSSSEPHVVLIILISVLTLVWLAVFFVPSLAVTVRRLHDRDMSGWWYLGLIVANLIPFVGPIVSIGFTVLMFLPGTPGPNRFGNDPKDPANASVFA